MNSYKNKAGKKFDIEITVGDLREFKRGEHDIDILGEDDDRQPEQELVKLFGSPAAQLDLIFQLVKKSNPKLTQKEFDDGLPTAILKTAFAALRGELEDFFSILFPGRSNVVKAAMKKLGEMSDTIVEAMTETLNENRENLKKRIKKDMTTAINTAPPKRRGSKS